MNGSYATNFSSQANAVATTKIPTSSPYTVDSTTYHVCVDTSILNYTVNLPSTVAVGVQYSVDDCTGHANSHPITVMPPSGLSIDGAGSYTISSNYGSWSGYYTGFGSNWKTTAHQ